jgi:WD repeat-containing protein 48
LSCPLTLSKVNLGRWILRYLFANLIDEEIKRDEAYRKEVNEKFGKRQGMVRANTPGLIELPLSPDSDLNGSSVTTPRANGLYPMTPGLQIGLASPGATAHLPGVPEDPATPGSPTDKRSSQFGRPSADRADYFSSGISSADPPAKPASTPAEKETEAPSEAKDKEKEKDKENGKSPMSPFGKKFRMGMSFGSKKLGRSSSSSTDKPTVVEEKKDEENKSESSSNHEKEFDDSFHGVIQKIRSEYEKHLADFPDRYVETKLTPSLPVDTPVLKLPSNTKVIIQEETSGSSANLYQGTVECAGQDADVIEQKAPSWLGEVLLLVRERAHSAVLCKLALLMRNRTPYRQRIPSRSPSSCIPGRTHCL